MTLNIKQCRTVNFHILGMPFEIRLYLHVVGLEENICKLLLESKFREMQNKIRLRPWTLFIECTLRKNWYMGSKQESECGDLYISIYNLNIQIRQREYTEQKIHLSQVQSGAPQTFKMESFTIIVNGFSNLSILDVCAVLHTLLVVLQILFGAKTLHESCYA